MPDDPRRIGVPQSGADYLRSGPDIGELMSVPGLPARVVGAPDLMGDPRTPSGVVGTVTGALRALAGEPDPDLQLAAAPKPGKTFQALQSMARIPIAQEARRVRPTTQVTPGQLPLETMLGSSEALAAQNAEASVALNRADVLQRAAELRKEMVKPSQLERAYDVGKYQGTWYTGAGDEITRQIGPQDAVTFAKMIASTSPRQDPLANLEQALRAYTRWQQAGRPPTYNFEGFMGAYRQNLQRAIQGQPLEGMKVSNYLLDILGSEQHPTIDRWMVNILLRRPTTAANLTSTEYQAAANRLQEIAPKFGTTPVRLQASLWTGQKLIADERMLSLLAKGLTREQTIPALREVIRFKAQEYRAKGLLGPEALTPGVVLGLIMLENKMDPITMFEGAQKAAVQQERGAQATQAIDALRQ